MTYSMTQQIASQELAQQLAETQKAETQQKARNLTAMPLNMAASGETVVVQEIRGGQKSEAAPA